MAEQYPRAHANNSSDMPPDQNSKEPGCFDFIKKKEQKSDQEDLVMTDLNAAKGKKEEKHTLMDELQRTHSNSSSSSEEEEVEEGAERKKKGLKEAIKENISGDKEGENTKQTETCIPMDKCSSEEEKKGFLEKIKEKLPGQHKKDEEDTQTPPACEQYSPGVTADAREKKGIMDKIKEKLPGHHKTNENDEVEN